MSNYSYRNPYHSVRHVRHGMRRGFKGMLHDAVSTIVAVGVLGAAAWALL